MLPGIFNRGGDDGSQLAREPDRYVKSGRDVR